MRYDSVKDIFASSLRKFPFLRVAFYQVLFALFLRSWHIRKMLRKINKEFSGKKLSILDAGCGFAQFSYFIAKNLNVDSILAIDIKEDYLNDAKEFFAKKGLDFVKFEKKDLTEISYDCQFDAIICIEVLEHIHEDGKVIDNFYRALKNGGRLLITSPSIYSEKDEEGEAFVGEHARQGYSTDDLAKLLKNSGFEILELKYTYGTLGTLAWKLAIKYPLIAINKTKFVLALLPFYYVLIFPFYFLLTFIDVNANNKKGSGVICVAKK